MTHIQKNFIKFSGYYDGNDHSFGDDPMKLKHLIFFVFVPLVLMVIIFGINTIIPEPSPTINIHLTLPELLPQPTSQVQPSAVKSTSYPKKTDYNYIYNYMLNQESVVYKTIIYEDINVQKNQNLSQSHRQINEKISALHSASLSTYRQDGIPNEMINDFRREARIGMYLAFKELWEEATRNNDIKMKRVLYPYVQRYKDHYDKFIKL